ncbi:MAG: hypothetical protein PWP58_1229, partial [Bacillota bacterium]|nr:hypothetical protein [Bacillota bacterium]
IIRLESKRSGRSHLTGLGISNVHKRLQYHFGAEYHWDIQSRLGEGTKITLFLPYRPAKAGS